MKTNDNGDAHRTVAAVTRHEGDKIKGSRFIATVRPMRDEAELPPVVDALRAEFPEANHHCYAYRLGRGLDRFRHSDDGEPSGTGGKPILQRIDGHDLTDVLVVVTRIFGGTKLGPGGLIRAYGGAAGAALDRAEIVRVVPTRRVRLSFPYELVGVVQSALTAAELQASESCFGERVTMRVDVPERRVEAILTELRERCAGRLDVEAETRS